MYDNVCVHSCRMPFHFCPQCGTKLQPDFRFCPSCGEKLPSPADKCGPAISTTSYSLSAPTRIESTPSLGITSSTGLARPALQKTHNFLLSSPEKYTKFSRKVATSSVVPSTSPVKDDKTEVRGKSKLSSPSGKQAAAGARLSFKASGTAEESAVDGSSPTPRSPFKGKSKAKRAKHAFALEPLQEGEEVTDTTGKKWKLMKQQSQSTTELIYEVSRPSTKESNHILKLAAKDGRIFNEQNFLQRAAKPASVEKWVKQNHMDFLGIPSCVGFGLHADSYRFLIFPSMGQSLHSVIEEENEPLSQKVVLQLACRILDVLQYIHSNEYVHADINAKNIYVAQGQKSQIYLVGYELAFRYCPGGQHVEYREASRTPHEGTIEFISMDAHKGAAPSRRSDLQSLGYCMLHWCTGMLPWTDVSQPDQVASQKQMYMDDVKALLRHCFGKKTVSSAFQTYLTSVMALQYAEQPDYSALKDGLSAALLQLGGSMEQPLGI
uniref:VRK serine/threonine kinase 3 n=2 Tax=Stegastes partitus TaxID=144197 RepID=A0A3B5AZ21_9TELE